MPIRGENIGTAYVRIIADGRDLDESIREMFDDQADTLDGAGRRGSAAYRQGFIEENNKAPNVKALNDSLRAALVKGDFLETRFFREKKWLNFRAALTKEFGEAGRLAGDRMEQNLLRSGIEGLDGMLDNLNAIIIDAQGELQREIEKMQREHGQALVENERRDAAALLKESQDRDREFEANHRAHLDRIAQEEEEAYKDRLDMDREFEANIAALLEERRDQERLAAEMHAEWTKEGIDLDREFALSHAELGREAEKLHDTYALLNRETAQLFRGDRNAMGRNALLGMIRQMRADMERLNIENDVWTESLHDTERNLIRLNPTLRRTIRNIDSVADGFGRAFGKGSRNDFLNFIGSFAGGMARAPGLLFRAADGLLRFRNEARLAFSEAGGGLRGTIAGMSSLLTSFGKIGTSIAGGIAGAFLFAGPLLSMLSLLAGAITALAGTITMGLVSALGTLAAASLPALAGIGALVAGMNNLEGETKRAAKGIAEEFKGLGEAAAEGLMFDRTAVADDHNHAVRSFADVLDNIRSMVADFRPVMVELGRGMADALDIITQRLSGADGAWTQFIDAVSGDSGDLGFLAVQARRISVAFGNTFGGLLGLFRGLMPSVREFTGWLGEITRNFNEWANSIEGQREIKEFMADAADSARELGDFLGAVNDLLWELITVGNEAGDSLFGSMTEAIEGWTEALRADGSAGLRQWFDDSREFAESLGNVLVGVGKLFDTLDTETSRFLATTLLETLASALEVLSALLAPVSRLLDGLNRATDGAVVALGGLVLVAPRILGALTNISGGLATFSADMRNAETRASRLGGIARSVGGTAGLGLMAVGATQSNKAMGILLNTLGGAATGFSLGGPIGALIGGGLGGLLGIVTAAGRASDAVDTMKDRWEGLAATLDQVTGATTAATKAYLYDELARQGILGALEAEGISRRTVIDAMTGQRNAQRELFTAMGQEDVEVQRLTNSLDGLYEKRRNYENLVNSGVTLNDAQRRNYRAVIDEIDATEKLIDTKQNNLDTIRNGLDVLQRETERTQERSAAINELSRNMRNIPKRIEVKIKDSGIIPTTEGVANLAEKYDLLDRRQIKTLITESGADTTVKKVLKLIEENNTLDKQRPKPVIDSDTRPFDDNFRSMQGDLQSLTGRRWTTTVDANVGAAIGAVAGLARELANLPQTKTVYVDYVRRNRVSGGDQEFASGGIVSGRQRVIAGEAGPEAIVPLNRDLSLVDPAVRWLSAIAQGFQPTGTAGRTVDVGGIQIVTPSDDPHAVAQEAINALTGALL